jgi:hypothetical protein
VAPAAPRGIDRRPDEHHRADLLRPADGKLGDDLAAHRVRDEGGADQFVRLDPGAERVCVLAEADRPAQLVTLALARQVRDKGRARARQRTC